MRASVFIRIAVVGVMAAALVPATGAWAKKAAKEAKDVTPPAIEHTPLHEHDGKGPLVIEARIADDKSGVFEPTLLVRAAGKTAFVRVTMVAKEGAADVYTAEVPKDLLAGDIEYLIEAFDKDGNGPSRVGDEGTPLTITRDVPAAPPPPPPPPPPEDEGPSPALIGAGVAVGAVVLVGAAVGGGLLFYALRPPAPAQVAIKVSAPSPVAAAP